MPSRHRLPSEFAVLIGLSLLLAGAFCPAAADPVETKFVASDGALGDRFGSGVALAGDYAVIGSQADDDQGGDAGAAYIFDVVTATQLLKVYASDGAGGDYFGTEVSASGNRAVAGALRDDHVAIDAGSAYVFEVPSGTELHKLTASDAEEDDWFGNSVSICPSYVLVGAYKKDESSSKYDSGAAYLYDAATGLEVRKLTASDAGRQDQFGYAVAVTDQYAAVGAAGWDGIGAQDCGAVYVYDVATGEELWMLPNPDLGPYERFGNAVDIEGDLLLVGAYWDENEAGSNAGAAYLFDLTSGELLHELFAAEPEGGGDWYGTSVALSGAYAVIGASQQGYGTELEGFACIVNVLTGVEEMKLTASDAALDDNYGAAVAADGNRALIGSDSDDDMSYSSGSAYLYEPIFDPASVPDARAGRALRSRCYPNPFGGNTQMQYTLSRAATVRLSVFDASGRRVRTLVDGEPQAAGRTVVAWDGSDDRASALPEGIYFYRLEADDQFTAGKVIRLGTGD